MNFLSQTSVAPNEQIEQKPEGEIRVSARTDCGHIDPVDDDVRLASNNLDTLMRRMSLTSTRELDSLIGELKSLRAKIASDGGRVEHLIREYTELNQSVIQLTKIISDGLTHLKKLPVLPNARVLTTTQNGEDAA
jgi:hypothetical protein